MNEKLTVPFSFYGFTGAQRSEVDLQAILRDLFISSFVIQALTVSVLWTSCRQMGRQTDEIHF